MTQTSDLVEFVAGTSWVVFVGSKQTAVQNDGLRQRVSEIRWWHQIDLGNGLITPGEWDTPKVFRQLHLPSLQGKAVLDIGSWDGFYAFEAEKRGASRVLATDWFCWGGPGGGTKDGFDLAHAVLNSKVEAIEIDVLDHSPETVGTFDVVLFLGVLYHMRNPILALEKVASVTKELLVLETHVDMLGITRPALAFYPGSSLVRDSTNWFGPNEAAVRGMLAEVGFKHVDRVYPSSAVTVARHWAGRLWDLVVPGRIMPGGFLGRRMAFHAWK